MMSVEFKYGLRNAADLLDRLKRKYGKCEVQDSQFLHHNKTFIEQESLQLYQNQSMPFKAELGQQEGSKHVQKSAVDNFSEIINKQGAFCQKIVILKLQETLKTFQQDLEQLSENKTYMEEKVEFLADKIKKMKDIQNNNALLSTENAKAAEFLNTLITQYHLSMQVAFKSQITLQESFNLVRSKIRRVLKETGQDYYYIGFIDHWNKHIEMMNKNRAQITQMSIEKTGKLMNRQNGLPNKGKQENQDEFIAPDEPRPKKKMSQSEKALLLGDLKSFAKSFKFPSA